MLVISSHLRLADWVCSTRPDTQSTVSYTSPINKIGQNISAPFRFVTHGQRRGMRCLETTVGLSKRRSKDGAGLLAMRKVDEMMVVEEKVVRAGLAFAGAVIEPRATVMTRESARYMIFRRQSSFSSSKCCIKHLKLRKQGLIGLCHRHRRLRSLEHIGNISVTRMFFSKPCGLDTS